MKSTDDATMQLSPSAVQSSGRSGTFTVSLAAAAAAVSANVASQVNNSNTSVRPAPNATASCYQVSN